MAYAPASDLSRTAEVKERAAVLYQRCRTHLFTLIAGSLSLWLVANWAQTAHQVTRYYDLLPAFDYWRVPYDLYYSKTLGIQIFLHPHNEHRIVFPELIYLLDVLWHGRLILPLVVSFLCYFGTWLLLSWIMWRDRDIPIPTRIVAILLAGSLIGWKGAAVVLGDPFLLQWTFSTLSVVLSFVFLLRAHESRDSRSLAASIIAAIVATFSSANCLIAWPLLILAASILRLRRQHIAVILTAAVTSIGLYFFRYHPVQKVNPFSILFHPLSAIGFIATYISMPFGDMKSPQFGIYLGIANIVVFALLFVCAIRKRILLSRTAVVFFAVFFFTLLTGAMTAAGRINTAGVGFSEAKASRYWALPLINWAVLILLCNWNAVRRRWKPFSAFAMNAVFVILMIIGIVKLRSALESSDDDFANRQFAALSIENGLRDSGITRRMFPDPALVFLLLPYLEDHHLSIYSSRTKLLGKPSFALAPVKTTPWPGEISYTFPVVSGIEVVGWAEPDRGGSEQIVFLNENREIVGVGRRLSAGFPADLATPRTPGRYAWVGFVNLSYGGRNVSAYFLGDHALRPIADPVTIDLGIQRASNDAGTQILALPYQADAIWTVNGIPSSKGRRIVPRGKVYGSWSGSDRNTGQMMFSSFASPASGCLLVPVLHGPSTSGLSVEIGNADSGQLLKVIPMQNGDMEWAFWKITVDKPVRHVRIIARDQGSAWGQWLAIAQPTECETETR